MSRNSDFFLKKSLGIVFSNFKLSISRHSGIIQKYIRVSSTRKTGLQPFSIRLIRIFRRGKEKKIIIIWIVKKKWSFLLRTLCGCPIIKSEILPAKQYPSLGRYIRNKLWIPDEKKIRTNLWFPNKTPVNLRPMWTLPKGKPISRPQKNKLFRKYISSLQLVIWCDVKS